MESSSMSNHDPVMLDCFWTAVTEGISIALAGVGWLSGLLQGEWYCSACHLACVLLDRVDWRNTQILLHTSTRGDNP